MDIKVGDKIKYKWPDDAGNYEDHLELFPELHNGAVFTVTEVFPFEDSPKASFAHVEEYRQLVFYDEIDEIVKED